MSVTKVLFPLCALSAFCVSCFCQTYVAVDFEQLAAPSGCVRPGTSTITTPIPSLKLPGVTISGGQVLSYANPYQISNNVYSTLNSCAGVQPAITIAFDGPVSGLTIGAAGQIWTSSESLQVQDDRGGNQAIQLLSSNTAGTTIFFANNNIRKVTLTLPSAQWSQSSPAGFYIDNISFRLNLPVNFIDPVPSLMSGTGIVTDPEALATLGTLVKGVAADGAARVVLSAKASHVGEAVTFTVLNERGRQSDSQEDGGVTTLGGSSRGRSQSVQVAAQDSTNGPMAFALYYPPSDFSRGSQDNQLTHRTVGIQVESAAPNTPDATRPLLIMRPPVVLVHDLWGDPADWDAFTPLVTPTANDPRFFVRRASYNGVLGNRIAASFPAFQSANIARAKESSLGLGYNAPLLLTEIAQFVNEFRATENVAAGQADVVVHGMGGTIARASVQLANYAAPESFGQGSVNKLITIGTPHLGTPLATALLRNENACLREILGGAGDFSFTNATVDGNNISGGLGDIQGNGFGGGLSPALARIQQRGDETAPTAMIAGIANNSNTSGLDKTLSVARFIRLACPGSPLASSLTSSGWPGVFPDAGDSMVPRFSQLAGMSGFEFFGLVHSEGLERLGFNAPSELDSKTQVTTAVINLLNTQVQSDAFQPLP